MYLGLLPSRPPLVKKQKEPPCHHSQQGFPPAGWIHHNGNEHVLNFPSLGSEIISQWEHPRYSMHILALNCLKPKSHSSLRRLYSSPITCRVPCPEADVHLSVFEKNNTLEVAI
jgi:hypothetical protein